ncbi:MAG: helix-turn-helix domain-containing protein [Owenweeksia sp.]|jgi:transcriptional regulator with XRE-family HTH domain
MIENASLQALLRNRRLLLGYSQEFIAFALDTSQARISRIEKGSVSITFEELRLLLPLLKIEYLDLLQKKSVTRPLQKDSIIQELFKELNHLRAINQELTTLLKRFTPNRILQ